MTSDLFDYFDLVFHWTCFSFLGIIVFSEVSVEV